WASWCAACRQALPLVEGIRRRFVASPVIVVGINVDKARDAADLFLATNLPSHGMTLLRDPEGEALARFGADGMPAIYVVDSEGIVRYRESGYAPEHLEAVESVITTYLPRAHDGEGR